jgi:hypothetical protein
MKRAWFITVSCLVLVAGILVFPSTQPLEAAKTKTKAQCLESCQSEYTICSNKCDKKKTLQDQSKCVNNCVSVWNCCQDICYGTRKTCP